MSAVAQSTSEVVPAVLVRRRAHAVAWRISWPLVVAIYASLLALHAAYVKQTLLMDGDTYWHVAAGQWILKHLAVPAQDPFSYTMRGAPWTAQEWLSEVMFALLHDARGWQAVVVATALAFGATSALLCRALLRTLDPAPALIFTALGVSMALPHLLARPFALAMPVMVLWTIGLVRAADGNRAPSFWLIPLLALWANLHGGFTLGIAISFGFAAEALAVAWKQGRVLDAAYAWGPFLVLALLAGLLTPQGIHGYLFTWQVMVEDSFALNRVAEWASPNFHVYQPLLLWLLAGLALVLHQGLRLPWMRLFMVLALLHLALAHVRNVEILGLLAPLIVAAPFSVQWQERQLRTTHNRNTVLQRLSKPAGTAAAMAGISLVLVSSLVFQHVRPLELPQAAVPTQALTAAREANLEGRVFNDYGWGGYLIYAGIAPFIDSRSDMYRDSFFRRYIEARDLQIPGALESLLNTYGVSWTLLRPGTPAVAMLDQLPGWHRVYADKNAVIHARSHP